MRKALAAARTCKRCGQKTTPEPKPRGQDAPKGSADACLAVARMLQVSQFAAGETSMSPREPPMPATSEVTELDELYTFAGSKNRYFLITVVDRETGWVGLW